jgi:hypothetical protein
MSSSQPPSQEEEEDNTSSTPNIEDSETLSRVANLLNISATKKSEIEAEINKTHKFWDNQPVPRICMCVDDDVSSILSEINNISI